MADWYVLRSATRREKSALSSLRNAGYTAYMPARTMLARHARKTEKRYPPLFIGYMFLLDPGEKGFYALDNCDGVSGLVYANGRPAKVAHKDVASFFFAQWLGAFDETSKLGAVGYKPKRGDTAKIIQGPYSGVVGKVLRLESKARVRLLYELFGRSGEVTIPIAKLEAA